MGINYQTQTHSYVLTQHFISVCAYNFCRRAPACYYSVLRPTKLLPLPLYLAFATAKSGFMSMGCPGVRYLGWPGAVVSGVCNTRQQVGYLWIKARILLLIP